MAGKVKAPKKKKAAKPKKAPKLEREKTSELAPIVRMEFDKLTPSLNVWQNLKWQLQAKEKKEWEAKIAEIAMLKGYSSLGLPNLGKRRIVVARFYASRERDKSNIIGPFNKCITDALQEKVQRKVEQSGKKNKMEWVPGILPIIRGDDPDNCLEVIVQEKSKKTRLVVEVWEEDHWNQFTKGIAESTNEIALAVPKEKKLPKCRQTPGLFDSEDMPFPLDLVWTLDAYARDDEEASAIVVARHDSGNRIDLALLLFRYDQWTIEDRPRVAIRRSTKQIHMTGVDDPTPWVSLSAEQREFVRKAWEEWVEDGRKIRKEGQDKATKEKLKELASKRRKLKAEWAASKAETSGLKKELDKASDELGEETLNQDEPSEWPWPED